MSFGGDTYLECLAGLEEEGVDREEDDGDGDCSEVVDHLFGHPADKSDIVRDKGRSRRKLKADAFRF